MRTIIRTILLASVLFLIQACSEPTKTPDEKTPSTIGDTERLTLLKAIEGQYQFTIKTFNLEQPKETLGYLKLEDGAYQYVAEKESPLDFAFIKQQKGTYSINFEANQDPSTDPHDLEGEPQRICRIKFDVFGGPGGSIDGFYLAYDPSDHT
ncbi:MAG: hypothetical protein AAF598_20775, partial [Bacteroidota bacterium]